MKKITLFLTVVAIFIALNTNAKIWTVANFHNAADFTTLQAAIDGASAGDTLYIEGSAVSYGNGIFNKKLVVFGNGYWLTENPNTQARKESSIVGQLTFNAGSQGSEIQGLYVYAYFSLPSANFSLITINCNNIMLARNLIHAPIINIANSLIGKVISITVNCENIIIKQNWIDTYTATSSSNVYNGSIYAVSFTGVPTNCIISNNMIRAYKAGTYGGTPYSIVMYLNQPSGLLVSNNVIWGDVSTYYTEHTNNILVSGVYSPGYNTATYNNIGSGTQYPISGNNKQNVNMTTVFENVTKYIDYGYILKAGSPAIGAGTNGVDCGAFGGGNPYVLSGLPPIPAIYEVTIQPYGTTIIPVNIKAKSHL